MAKIAFGTSGWRGILGDDFTFDGARRVTAAIATLMKERGTAPRGVVVGYDARFAADRLAREACRVLDAAGLRAFLCDRDTPTPVIAHEVVRRGAGGAINFTASHNPAEYAGLKFSPEDGGPARKEDTKRIEALCESEALPPLGKGPAETIDPRPAYLDRVFSMIDSASIAKAAPRVLAHALWGAGRGYLDELLRRAGARVEAMGCDRADPTFGGRQPEPAPAYVPEMVERLKAGGFDLGLGTDGDADRFGVFDGDGSALEAGEVIALLLDDLAERGMKGVVVRTIPTTHLIDAVARLHGCETIETPVGFKWIAEVMSKRPDEFVIGGEESGGLTIRGHVPEKDGILACLLVAGLCARRGKGPRALLDDLRRRVGGGFYTRRVNLRFDSERRAAILRALEERPPAALAGRRVVTRDTRDGFKFLLEDGAWLALRFSGTEPVIRVYVEAGRAEGLDALADAGRSLIG